MDILKDNLDMFEKAGFSLEEFGDNTIKLTGVPNILHRARHKRAIFRNTR